MTQHESGLPPYGAINPCPKCSSESCMMGAMGDPRPGGTIHTLFQCKTCRHNWKLPHTCSSEPQYMMPLPRLNIAPQFNRETRPNGH